MIRHRIPRALALAITLSLAAGSVRAAEIQKSGPEVFPGKFAVSVNPFGVQAAFDGFSTGGYKFAADFAANLKSMEKLTIWLGADSPTATRATAASTSARPRARAARTTSSCRCSCG